MNLPQSMQREELIDILNRCWMTHDGMWFYHCLQEFGIEKTNQLNKSAIRGMAPFEVERMKRAFGIQKERIESFQEFKDFFSLARTLFIPPFMNASLTFPEDNVLHWEFAPGNCFAFKGISRIGVIEQYECGVIYRIECWLNSLGIKYRLDPKIGRCLMAKDGKCSGSIYLEL